MCSAGLWPTAGAHQRSRDGPRVQTQADLVLGPRRWGKGDGAVWGLLVRLGKLPNHSKTPSLSHHKERKMLLQGWRGLRKVTWGMMSTGGP